MFNCPNCGAPADMSLPVCPYCGTPYPEEDVEGCVVLYADEQPVEIIRPPRIPTKTTR